MFSRPKILFLVSLLFVALLNPKLNPYLLFKFLIFYHSSQILAEDTTPYGIWKERKVMKDEKKHHGAVDEPLLEQFPIHI